MAAAAAKGVSLNHIARGSSDIKRLSKFYKEMFGFEEVETPDFGQFKIIWMRLPSSSFLLHLIPGNNEEVPSSIPVKDPSHIRLGHHLCFSISNFHSFHNTLKDKGIETFETNLGNINRVFFYDPDGNGLEKSVEEKSEAEMAGEGVVSLNHISRESTDIKRLAKFYQEIFGFEEVESPKFGEFKVLWLRLPSSSLYLHIIERNPSNNLPEGPWSATSPVKDPSHLPRGHHLCFSVSNFQSFLHTLKDKGIETFEKSLPNGKIKQVFFFDPDGNGLEAASREDSS